MEKLELSDAKKLGFLLRESFFSLGLTSQSSIEMVTGVHQAQVSRILAGNFKCLSQNVKILCKYANIDAISDINSPITLVNESGHGFDKVRQIFDVVWDGSEEHIDTIVNLILATRPLTQRPFKLK